MAEPPLSDLYGFAEEHLYYEAWMFVTARAELHQRQSSMPAAAGRGQPPHPDERFTTNLHVEACVLHFRNLVDFLYILPTKPDDVTAADYVPGWVCPPLPDDLEKARVRANKELAHLTSKRLPADHPDKPWDFPALGRAMRTAVDDFLNRVEARNMPARTADALREIGDFVLVAEGAVSHGTSTTSSTSSVFGATGPGDWSRE